MRKMTDILSLYEDIRLHKGALSGAEGFFDYQAPDSIHSEVTAFAYGIRETQSCVSLRDHPCTSLVSLEKAELLRRFYIKLKACIFNWREYICPIEIKVNGQLAYKNDREFFENVNLGWPVIYIPIDGTLLQEGENEITLSQGKFNSHLLVSKVDLLSLPEIKPHQQLTYCPSARLGDALTLAFHAPDGCIPTVDAAACEVLSIERSPLFKEQVLVTLKLTDPQAKATLYFGKEAVEAILPELFPAGEDICLVGIDSDDHRHDDSDETNRIISIFTNTHLGNYFQARPQHGRNYYDLSSPKVWEQRIRHLIAYQKKLSLSDSGNVMGFLPAMAGDSFVGKHLHEPYLYFQPLSSPEIYKWLQESESFGQSKRAFCDYLKQSYEESRSAYGRTSVGSPSLLTAYEAAMGFERVTIEPVSNVNLLIAAVRGAAPEMWGAHVPTDWYFGEPHDLTKARKFLTAMQMLYIFGADYIYPENALFKTNAFSRTDWDDEFPTICRAFQRDFYDYVIRNPREGALQTEMAVIYGNNEYFMWHHDNRMAELPEGNDWDQRLWGKWEDCSHHKCWRAIDAWLPEGEDQHSKQNVLNVNLFSGTPYGMVDVVPYEKDYSKYKAIALLGWNTYEEGFARKIYDYIAQGGTAFVSYCHFNKTDRNDLPMTFERTEEIRRLIGTCDGPIIESNGFSIWAGDIYDAEPLMCERTGNVVAWRRQIGEGTLYFGGFADYRCTEEKLEIMQEILRMMAAETAEVICDNPNICFSRRVTAEGKQRLHLMGVCTNGNAPQAYTLTFRDGRTVSGKIAPTEIVKVEV